MYTCFTLDPKRYDSVPSCVFKAQAERYSQVLCAFSRALQTRHRACMLCVLLSFWCYAAGHKLGAQFLYLTEQGFQHQSECPVVVNKFTVEVFVHFCLPCVLRYPAPSRYFFVSISLVAQTRGHFVFAGVYVVNRE